MKRFAPSVIIALTSACAIAYGGPKPQAANRSLNLLVERDASGHVITRRTLAGQGQADRVDYYYDGARRVQEVATVGGDPQTAVAEREYVYGPGYVDEFVVQIVPGNAAGSPPVDDSVIYVTQDANYNVTGLWDEGGGVLAQYTYEPYGQCVAAEHFTDPPVLNRLGHQGLFFENFDDPAAGLTATTAAPGAVTTGVYHNRNRHYSPALGRFLQRDPNETGQPVIKDLAAFGQPPCNCPNNIDIMEAYQDGANLFEYVGSSPVNYSDPGGLD